MLFPFPLIFSLGHKERLLKKIAILPTLSAALALFPARHGRSGRDAIDKEVADWTLLAGTDGYHILDTIVSTISSEPVVLQFDLGPGTYHINASGGMNISDLDAVVKDSTGKQLDSDTEPDKIPMMDFTIPFRDKIQVTLTVSTFAKGATEDYFCLLVEGENPKLFGTSGGPVEAAHKHAHGKEGEDSYQQEAQAAVEQLNQLAQEVKVNVITCATLHAENKVNSLSFQLDPGVYAVMAKPDSRCSNLDIAVYDANGAELAEDRGDDDRPYCEFFVESQQNIRIDFEVAALEDGASDTWLGYMLELNCSLDEPSRKDFVQGNLDSMKQLASQDGSPIIDSGMNTLSQAQSDFTLQYNLDPGLLHLQRHRRRPDRRSQHVRLRFQRQRAYLGHHGRSLSRLQNRSIHCSAGNRQNQRSRISRIIGLRLFLLGPKRRQSGNGRISNPTRNPPLPTASSVQSFQALVLLQSSSVQSFQALVSSPSINLKLSFLHIINYISLNQFAAKADAKLFPFLKYRL